MRWRRQMSTSGRPGSARGTGFPWLWLFVMTLVVGGCSTYRSVRMPDAPEQAPAGDPRPTIRAGNLVRVTLASGETLSGKVWRVSPDELVVGIVANHAVEGRVMLRQDIQAIEECSGTTGSNIGLGFLATLMIGTLGIFILLSTADIDLS